MSIGEIARQVSPLTTSPGYTSSTSVSDHKVLAGGDFGDQTSCYSYWHGRPLIFSMTVILQSPSMKPFENLPVACQERCSSVDKTFQICFLSEINE